MAQRWHDLLFAHWPISADRLRTMIPPELELDTYEGQAWLGIVPFWMSGVRPRGVPSLPWLSTFPELNVRTYVTHGDRPGVWFLSLDAANRLAVRAARFSYHLPYFHARMSATPRGDAMDYVSQRIHPGAPPAEFQGRYRPTGDAAPPQPGSLAHWLTERYCLYAVDARGRLYCAEILHPPWALQPAAADIDINTMAAAHGIKLPAAPPLLHFSRLQPVVVWPIKRVLRTD
jgi:hypothetical protein